MISSGHFSLHAETLWMADQDIAGEEYLRLGLRPIWSTCRGLFRRERIGWSEIETVQSRAFNIWMFPDCSATFQLAWG